MRKAGWIGLLIVAVLCSGCSAMQKTLFQNYSAPDLDDEALTPYGKLVTSLKSPATGQPLIDARCFAAPVAAGDIASCTAQRNQVVAALIIGSEQLCTAHRRSIYGNDAGWNIALGSMTNLFAGAASVATVTQTKSILSALALFSNSERSLVNETVYKTMLVTAVDKKILETRNAQMTAIDMALVKPIDAYGMHDALRNVTTLHASCSFMLGLQKALDEGAQGSSAQRAVRLRATLASIGAEMDAIQGGDRTGSKKLQFDQLSARYNAVSTTITKLESE